MNFRFGLDERVLCHVLLCVCARKSIKINKLQLVYITVNYRARPERSNQRSHMALHADLAPMFKILILIIPFGLTIE